jgi:outer membrane protein W
MIPQLFSVLILSLFTFVSLSSFDLAAAQAATIQKVKGRKVLINLEGDSAKQGQIFYVLSNGGKKRGIIKIRKVKGDRAIAVLGKGRARKGWTIAERGKKGKSSARRGSRGSSHWGVMGGYSMQSMSSEISVDDGNGNITAQTTNMSGSGFSAKAIMDYQLFSSILFRGMVGMEMFSTSSADTFCGNGGDEECTADITYLTLDLWARYAFSPGGLRPWVGLGFDLMFPMAKEATAIDDSSITNTSVIAFGGGIDYMINSKTYIPLQIEYGIFPSSKEVTASTITARFGIAFAW